MNAPIETAGRHEESPQFTAGEDVKIHEYISFDDCLGQGTHLVDADDDGYCNRCGNQ